MSIRTKCIHKALLGLLVWLSGSTHDCFAQSSPTVVVDLTSQDSTALVNDNFRQLTGRISTNDSNVATLNSYFVNGALAPKYGGLGSDASAWTSGDYVYLSSTGVFSHQALPQYHGYSLFVASGTFTAPAGITKVFITQIGGGAGGGGASNSGGSPEGGGGSAGSYVLSVPYTVIPGNAYTVTIGAAGVGVSGNDGTDGGSTTFDTLTVLGGKKGLTGNPGNAGASVGGQLGTTFNAGDISFASATGINGNAAYGGAGAGSPFGYGGNGTNSASAVGSNASGFGSAGGGARDTTGTSRVGGNGAPGFCLVQY